jgi:hypothetical protein
MVSRVYHCRKGKREPKLPLKREDGLAGNVF